MKPRSAGHLHVMWQAGHAGARGYVVDSGRVCIWWHGREARMGAKPKKIPNDKRFPIQIEDLTDFTDTWSYMERDEKANYTEDQFSDFFDPEVEVDDLEVWFSQKNAKNLTDEWLAGDVWELHELVQEEISPGPLESSSLEAKLVEHGYLETTPALTDDAGKIERFNWLKKPELAPFCESHGVKKSLKKDEIIEALVAAGAEPPPAFAFIKSSTFGDIIEENLARYVAAVGENLKRFPEAYRSTVAWELNNILSDWMKEPDSFIAQHLGVSIPDARKQARESARREKDRNEIRAAKEEHEMRAEFFGSDSDNAGESGQHGVSIKLIIAALAIVFILFLVL
jgi:hypothetical protein